MNVVLFGESSEDIESYEASSIFSNEMNINFERLLAASTLHITLMYANMNDVLEKPLILNVTMVRENEVMPMISNDRNKILFEFLSAS